jgi:hypothetical protein
MIIIDNTNQYSTILMRIYTVCIGIFQSRFESIEAAKFRKINLKSQFQIV